MYIYIRVRVNLSTSCRVEQRESRSRGVASKDGGQRGHYGTQLPLHGRALLLRQLEGLTPHFRL